MYSNSFNIEDMLFAKKNYLNRTINEPTEHDLVWIRAIGRSLGNKIGCIIFENKDEKGTYLDVYLVDRSLEDGYARLIIAPNYILSYAQEQLISHYNENEGVCIAVSNDGNRVGESE